MRVRVLVEWNYIEGRTETMRPIGLNVLVMSLLLGTGLPVDSGTGATLAAARVELLKTPNGGIQPQAAIDGEGALHLVYLKSDPGAADVYYVRRQPGKDGWSAPIRVNSRTGSAIAVGTIRGAQLALGRGSRVHVVWNGSGPNDPSRGVPLFYTRMNDAGTGFEPERNVMQFTSTLDGGGSVAADAAGNVYVVWHGNDRPGSSEADRRLWIARSNDDGKTFSREAPAYGSPTGACGCCGARAFADSHGSVYVLYRAATAGVDRDMVLLTSHNQGASFNGSRVHRWKLNACPMSSESFAESKTGVLAAWETRGQVYYGMIDPATMLTTRIIAAPEVAENRKHPAIAGNARGETLLVWTEGTGWQKGGSLAWQLFDRDGKPVGGKGRRDGAVPTWGLATSVARPDGGFTIVF
jgi:hypothetical protein